MQKNITLSIDEGLLIKARKKAVNENKTINQLFRDWVGQYIGFGDRKKSYRKIIATLDYVQPGGKFSRDDANER